MVNFDLVNIYSIRIKVYQYVVCPSVIIITSLCLGLVSIICNSRVNPSKLQILYKEIRQKLLVRKIIPIKPLAILPRGPRTKRPIKLVE